MQLVMSVLLRVRCRQSRDSGREAEVHEFRDSAGFGGFVVSAGEAGCSPDHVLRWRYADEFSAVETGGLLRQKQGVRRSAQYELQSHDECDASLIINHRLHRGEQYWRHG